jgi:Ca2+-binding EF-hand superfamily protein
MASLSVDGDSVGGGSKAGGGASAKDFQGDPNKATAKAKAAEKRVQIRDYIRNERDTIQRKWLCLQECVNSEERRKEEFSKMHEIMKTRKLPLAVTRLIQTLKANVRQEIRDVGGTAQSIIRKLFIYWDADNTGELDHIELKQCINHLGVPISDEDVDAIITYYGHGKVTKELHYQKLLEDVAFGEPTVFEYVPINFDDEIDINDRYETRKDKNRVMPPVVVEFIEAVRAVIARKMRNEGGTVMSHLRDAFLKFDHDYSNALDLNELQLSMKVNLKLQMSESQARAIVNYYDSSGEGQMPYDLLAKDVLKDQPPLLYHEELTKRTVDKMILKENSNKFISQKFTPNHSKVVESFKKRVIASIEEKLKSEGGSVRSVVRNAFIKYDPTLSGTIADINHFRSAVRKFGFTITEDEAKMIMRTYDKYGDGRIEYTMITADILKSDPSITQDAGTLDSKSSATARTPENVNRTIQMIKETVNKYVRKSAGSIEPRDLLYGTFCRFDSGRQGRVTSSELDRVLKEINVTLRNDAKNNLIIWFDSNSSNMLDYNLLVKQFYGDNMLVQQFAFPSVQRDFRDRNPNKKAGFSETFHKSLPPMVTARGTRYLDIPETEIEKVTRRNDRHKIILEEKLRITNKIKDLDLQKQRLLERKRLEKVGPSR